MSISTPASPKIREPNGYACLVAMLLAVVLAASADAQPGAQFDHNLTSFPLSGAHTTASCETCHRGGRFAGTPRLCEECHDGTGRLATTSVSMSHIPTAGDCGDCHSTRRWMAARMDHTVVTTQCDGCHYGNAAVGKSVHHIQTNAQCDACHSTSTWSNARFDHAEVFQPCSTCHDGTTGTGKDPVTHITTTAECDVCHSTQRWSPATFDHSGITQACSTCHDGSTATGKDPVTHITTAAECDFCHSTQRWSPATFDHALATGPCSSCHDNRIATGLPTPHFMSSLECDTCHTTTRWTAPTYAHTGMYPGDHRAALACTECHAGDSELVTWPSPGYQPDCAGCHERDFKADSHKKVDSPELKYTVSELRDCSGACHQFQDASMTVIKQRRDSEHRVGDSEF